MPENTLDGNRGPVACVPDLERDRRYAVAVAAIWRNDQPFGDSPSSEAVWREYLDRSRVAYGQQWVKQGFQSPRCPT